MRIAILSLAQTAPAAAPGLPPGLERDGMGPRAVRVAGWTWLCEWDATRLAAQYRACPNAR